MYIQSWLSGRIMRCDSTYVGCIPISSYKEGEGVCVFPIIRCSVKWKHYGQVNTLLLCLWMFSQVETLRSGEYIATVFVCFLSYDVQSSGNITVR